MPNVAAVNRSIDRNLSLQEELANGVPVGQILILSESARCSLTAIQILRANKSITSGRFQSAGPVGSAVKYFSECFFHAISAKGPTIYPGVCPYRPLDYRHPYNSGLRMDDQNSPAVPSIVFLRLIIAASTSAEVWRLKNVALPSAKTKPTCIL